MQIDEYRKLAEVEDELWYFNALNQRILLPLTPWRQKKADVLDAGCGTGGLLRSLREFGPKWTLTGLDYSALACDFAQQRTGEKIIQGSILDLPFANESFDIITCADVISQVEDGLQAMNEFKRVLKPGGMIVVNVAAYQWMWSYHDDTCETQHRYRRSELLKLVRETGMQPFQSSYANTFIFPMIIVQRKLLAPKAATSDVKTYPKLIDQFCGSLAKLEHGWLKLGGSFPLGCSVFLVALKNP
jgi:ubiquinone/menaquinone biosynthesis C-methylase UbiE